LQGSATRKANALESFQNATSESRVLLLAVHDASAAGSNLTTANHAIFVGPLFVPSLFQFRSIETQAVGRVRRYGQQKKVGSSAVESHLILQVHIHRLLTADTLDETLHEDRRRELLQSTDWQPYPQADWD
jgi:SNF2 family DNA or RNA helicase